METLSLVRRQNSERMGAMLHSSGYVPGGEESVSLRRGGADKG